MTRVGLLLALFCAGCASGGPAPISYGREPRSERTGLARPPQPAAVAPAPASEPDWAAGEGTPLSAYALRAEDAHPYDPARLPRTHRVSADEALADIAARYQIPIEALIAQNRLEPPYALARGRELELPPPRFHVISRGETFEDVARAYAVDPRSLALLNHLEPPFVVRENDRVVLPAIARPWQTPAAAPPAPALGALPSGRARFVPPLPGAILSTFGAQPSGARLDGVEIAGREGEPVAAAGDGEVVYAGDDLPAYGVLVLVRHADGLVTAYGYARRALVRAGESVRAGEPIAELGPRSDGRARLLFQVRRGREALDPMPLLGQPR